jgi:hypothetical protein
MDNDNEEFFEEFREHGIMIDRQKGTTHPRFSGLYPIDYGNSRIIVCRQCSKERI